MPDNLEAYSKARGPSEMISPLAGKPASKELLIDIECLEKEYFERRPDVGDPNQLVIFGTSGRWEVVDMSRRRGKDHPRASSTQQSRFRLRAARSMNNG